MVNINKDIWHWYHNVSECHYHIQLTIKYRKSLFDAKVESVILDSLRGIKERYAIEIYQVGFDQNHVHILTQFLPTHSGSQVVKILKSITAIRIFKIVSEIKKELWGGEFWTDGYYIGTVSARGNRLVIEEYIKKQGREQDIKQLKLFEL